MKLRILTIVLLTAAVALTLGAVNLSGTAKSNMNRALSQEEMMGAFGSACNGCTLGADTQTCNPSGCPSCRNLTLCGTAQYPSGNYVYLCNTVGGIEDGTCWQGEELDCTAVHGCSTDGPWPSRNCDVNCGHTGSNNCVECSKGTFIRNETSYTYTCVCG